MSAFLLNGLTFATYLAWIPSAKVRLGISDADVVLALAGCLVVASTGYAAFTGCQTAARLGGDRLRAAYGNVRIVRWLGTVALAGLAIAIFSPWVPLAVAGFGLLGAGLSVVIPVVFGAVGQGRNEEASARRAAP